MEIKGILELYTSTQYFAAVGSIDRQVYGTSSFAQIWVGSLTRQLPCSMGEDQTSNDMIQLIESESLVIRNFSCVCWGASGEGKRCGGI